MQATGEANHASGGTDKGWRARLGSGALWVITVLLALGMGVAGLAKFQGDTWIQMFAEWGYPAWFALLIGATEVTGAVLLLVPRLASYAAVVLIVIMLGAIYTVVANDSSLGPRIPMVYIVFLIGIAWARWSRRWHPSQ